MAEFIHSSINLLKCGISAEKLASIERIGTAQVQLYLYKLSILGLVGPARRDDLWAQLDAVLQSKSTPLRLTEEQRRAAGGFGTKPRVSDVSAWQPNRSAAGGDATNDQVQVSRLLELAAEEAARKQRTAET